jgi:hypothetical protein
VPLWPALGCAEGCGEGEALIVGTMVVGHTVARRSGFLRA